MYQSRDRVSVNAYKCHNVYVSSDLKLRLVSKYSTLGLNFNLTHYLISMLLKKALATHNQ